jgi:hypothetical protein
MIALRGIVRQNEEKKWSWRGVWTFGSLPEDEEAALNAKNPTVRPFVYTWEEARNASDVLVPSANITTEKKVEEKEPPTAVAGTPNEAADASKETMDSDSSKTEDASEDVEMTDAKAADESRVKLSDKVSPAEEKTEEKDVKPMEVDEASESKKDEEMKEVEETATKRAEESKTEPTKSNEETAEKSAEQTKSQYDENKVDADKPHPKDEPDKPKDTAQQEATPAKEAVTFATTSPDEPPFTEAATKYPDKCPPGGAWKGYFETATVRARAWTFIFFL